MNQQYSKILKKAKKALIHGGLIVFTALILAIILRVFFFSSFKVPSSSMEPAIVAGDFIIVNKQIPGPRIIKNFFSLQEGEKPDITRLSGFRKISRNDVLVFNLPYQGDFTQPDLNVYYTKRCIALPGDTLLIDNGYYQVKDFSDILGNYENQLELSARPDVSFNPNIYNCFPHDPAYSWNVKHFGTLYLPEKGCRLALDTLNVKLYRNPIQYETGKSLRIENGYILLGDSIIDNYTFRQNYYFMSGDHVMDSADSRYWGLLPEDHIIGKVAFIWKSKDIHSGKYRWKRFFKTVR
jgi:signal peptidase I